MAALDMAAAFSPTNWLLQKTYSVENQALRAKIMGLDFPNRLGLAAGFDKDGKHLEGLACLGFGHVEVGTVTPLPQPGNPKPRSFRLPNDHALINRMGFNNEGMGPLAMRLRRFREKNLPLIIGGNIGKNKATPNEHAADDYLKCFAALHPFVDYFVANVSSPNTPNLRELQDKKPLTELLERLQEANAALPRPKPLLLKIAPDLTTGQLDDIAEIVRATKLAGVVATNTTIARDNLLTDKNLVEKMGAGGLSGQPVQERSTAIVRTLREKLGPSFVLIGVGGIDSTKAAQDKLDAGADLVQVYTGFIYEGPALPSKILAKIQKV